MTMHPLSSILAAGMNSWEPADWVVFFGGVATVLGALAAAIVAILKAGRAEAKSDAANERVGNVSRAQDTMRSDLTHVASNATPNQPATTATPMPVELVAAKPDAVVSTIDKPKGG